MAGELLAQVLLDIGRDYSARQAEERALLRRDAEKLDERAYQKTLRAEQLAAEKDLYDYKQSSEFKQWEKQQEEAIQIALKQNRMLGRQQLEEKAKLAGIADPTGMSASELNEAIVKHDFDMKARTDMEQMVSGLRTNFGANVEVYNMGKSAAENFARTVQNLSQYDNTQFVGSAYKQIIEQLGRDKYGKPGPARDAALKAAGYNSPADDFMIQQEAAQQLKVAVASKPELMAISKELDMAAQTLREAQANAAQRGINVNAPMDSQSWFRNGKPSDYVAPVTAAPSAAPATPAAPTTNKMVLPASTTSTPAGPAPVDPSNPFYGQVQQAAKATAYQQFVPAYQQAQKSDAELQAEAASGSRRWFGLGSSDPTKAAQLYDAAKAQRAAAAQKAAELAGQLDGYTPEAYFRPTAPAASLNPFQTIINGFAPPTQKVTPEEQLAMIQKARAAAQPKPVANPSPSWTPFYAVKQ